MNRKSRSAPRRFERSLLSCALAGCMLLSAPALAQSTAGTIRGQVMADSTPAAQAQVTATNLATGLTRSVQTGTNGSYNLAGLPPGTYRIDVSANGQASSRTVTLAVGQTATLDLGVGGVAEAAPAGEATDMAAVVVTGQSLVETRTSEVATYISQKQIEALPQGTRNFLAFADTVPGMQFTQGSDGSTRLRSGAQSANAINVFIDGVGQKNYVLAGGVSGQDSTRGNPFPQAAIGEYKVITSNYKAEFDQLSSAAVVAATRSGSNEFHGSFFWDRTSTDWRAATEWEARDDRRDEFKEEQYGASFEGPIVRDRLHFFVAYEAKEYMSPRTVTAGQGFEDRVGELPVALQPLLGTFSSPFKQDMFFGKLTWSPGEAHLVEFTAKLRDEDELGNFDDTRTAEYGSLKENTDDRFDLRYQYNTDRLLNDLHLTYEDASWRPRPATLAPGYILTTSDPNNIILQAGGGPDFQDKGQKGLGIQNDFTFFAGAHTIKAGIKFKDVQISSLQQDPYNPQFSYDISQSTSIPFQVRFGAPLAGDGTGSLTTSGKQYGIYIQDDWEVNDRLTLNLGIRWDYETNPAYTDYVTSPDFVAALRGWDNINAPGSGIRIDEYISTGSERSDFKDAWQPRLGFSYDLNGDQRHVIFGGAGRAYDRNLFTQLALESIRHTFPPYTFSIDAPGHPCDTAAANCLAWDPAYYDAQNLYAFVAANPNLGAERYVLHNDLRTPYSDQFSIGMRNALGDWLTEVTLSRIESHDGLVFHLGNRRPDGDFFAPGTTWGQPWDDGAFGVPGFGRLIIGTNGIETRANTLALKFDKPYTQDSGWGVTVAYTYTDAEQNADTTSGGAFRYPSLDYYGWVPTDGVPEHRLVATGIYDAPWGIVLSGKLSLATPSPRYGDNCLPGWDDCFFDYYTPGGTLGFKQFDFAASRTWDTGTNLSFYVRGDLLNVFNWVNYDGRNDWFGEPGNPNPNLGAPNRQLQPTRTFKLSMGINW